MIFIVVKFPVKPEYADTWLEKVASFTQDTRNEPGNLWYEWSRSVEDPNTFVLVEAFEDGDAPAEHVGSAHFQRATQELPQYLTRTPDIINVQVPGRSWSELGEMRVP